MHARLAGHSRCARSGRAAADDNREVRLNLHTKPSLLHDIAEPIWESRVSLPTWSSSRREVSPTEPARGPRRSVTDTARASRS